MNPKSKLALFQLMAAGLIFEHPSHRDNFKHPEDDSAKSKMPTFEVNGMFIQAVNEQAAQNKYNKIISKRNRKQKQ